MRNETFVSKDVTIFGRGTELRRIYSGIEYSFDKIRNDLSKYMEAIAAMIIKLDEIEMLIHPIESNGLGNFNHELFYDLKSIHNTFRSQAARIPELWDKNEFVLRWLINMQDLKVVVPLLDKPSQIGDFEEFNNLFDAVSSSSENMPLHSNTTNTVPSPPSYDSLQQVLVHLSRDWTNKGADIRKVLYTDGVIKQLEQYLPVCNNHHHGNHNRDSYEVNPRVLVPGAGLGRLAVELAVRGYAVEANECSPVMVATMSSIINKLLMPQQNSSDNDNTSQSNDDLNDQLLRNSINEEMPHHPTTTETANNNSTNTTVQIYPHLFGQLVDLYDLESCLEAETVPSTDSLPLKEWFHSQANRPLTIKKHISINMNDFVSTYKYQEYKNHFDAIVTCFFIDTANNILEYLIIIRYVLKTNGVWINVGPLHYHRPTSFYYTYRQLKEIIIKVFKFEILYEEYITCLYAPEEGISMKPEVYKVPLLVMKKRDRRTETNNNDNIHINSNSNNNIENEDEMDHIFQNVNFILKR